MRALLILSDAAPKSAICVWDMFHVCVITHPDDGSPLSLCPAAELNPCTRGECRSERVVAVDLPPSLASELRALAAQALAAGMR